MLQEAVELFLQHGCLVIKNAFTHDYVVGLREEFTRSYGNYMTAAPDADALDIGDRRKMVTIGLDGAFGAHDYYAPPKIFPLLEFLLSEKLIVAAMGCVISFPGSQDQHRHCDHPNIYYPGFGYAGIEHVIARGAPYAITMGLPLVPITDRNGGTRFWPGSHLSVETAQGRGLDVRTQLGTCYLFDYRIKHHGIANRSDKPRMLLYNIYTQPWFRDTYNYSQQAPIRITEDQLEALPERDQRMFSWALADYGSSSRGAVWEGLCECGSGLLRKRCHGLQEGHED